MDSCFCSQYVDRNARFNLSSLPYTLRHFSTQKQCSTEFSVLLSSKRYPVSIPRGASRRIKSRLTPTYENERNEREREVITGPWLVDRNGRLTEEKMGESRWRTSPPNETRRCYRDREKRWCWRQRACTWRLPAPFPSHHSNCIYFRGRSPRPASECRKIKLQRPTVDISRRIKPNSATNIILSRWVVRLVKFLGVVARAWVGRKRSRTAGIRPRTNRSLGAIGSFE